MTLHTRRARQPDSLAASVVALLDEFQRPVSTTAMRLMLTASGHPVTAEHLGRLAAYEREDFRRTRQPPRLCWAIDASATAIKPRWWARGDWRLQRRIMTDDAKPIWIATLAEHLCRGFAERTDEPDAALVHLTLGSVAGLLGDQHFDVPMSRDEWRGLRRRVYEPFLGAFNNRTGATLEQSQAEATLTAAHLPASELFFGREH